MKLDKPKYSPEAIEQIQRKADEYQTLTAMPEFNGFLFDLTEIKNAYIDKVLGNWKTDSTTIKNYDEYKYNLGILHGLCKAMEISNEMIAEAIELQK